MARKRKTGRGERKLYTLTEISRRLKISMPTLQRYKKEYQDRIPSVGEGRKQRYPSTALEVFAKLKVENLSRRGRPAKAKGSDKGRRPTASRRRQPSGPASSGADSGLLTLTEVERRTGISYPTLLRYVELHGKRIPHEGKGRKRRYHPEAVAVFEELRAASPRGRRRRAPASNGHQLGLERKVRDLEKAHLVLEKQIRILQRKLERPFRVTLSR